MISNLLLKLKNLKENEIVIITDNVSKEEYEILKEVLQDE